MGEIDAGGDRRMRGSAQEQQLGDAEPQNVMDGGRARHRRAFERPRDQRIDLAEPPQHRRHQQAAKGAVAHRQLGHDRAVFDRVIERTLTAQDRSEQIERYLAC